MNDFAEPLPAIGDDYTLRYLTEDDGAAIQQLCERCDDYFDLITGLPPGSAEAQSLFVALPEGSSYDDKALLGVLSAPGERLIGVVDIVHDAPGPGEWWLGALLLDPAHRNHGLGARLVHALEAWMTALGAESARVSVLEQNTRGLAFWQQHGYVEVMREPPHVLGVKESVAVILRHPLNQA
jgi:GNAT superfamily N-acetyltransferase